MEIKVEKCDDIVVYVTGKDSCLEVRTDGETVWLTVEQMAKLFGRDRSVIGKHVRNVFSDGELPYEGFRQILPKTSSDGGRPIAIYNLDVLISVGYRVKSQEGVRFRQWATRVLREMLLNRVDELKRIGKLENRLSMVESDVEQIREGVDYLAEQLQSDEAMPRRRIGFGAQNGEPVMIPYGRNSSFAPDGRRG